MTEQLRQALAALRFNSAETPDDVWHTSPSHVDGLHTRAEHRIRTGVLDAKNSKGPSPIGLALQGQKGVGKTHLLGGVRQIVQREGGYFFLIDLTTGDAFWEDVVEAMRSELLRRTDDGTLQLTRLLERLCEAARVPDPKPILGHAQLTVDDLHGFVGAIRQLDAQVAVECGDTVRALVLYSSLASDQADIGMDYLAGREAHEKGWRKWGLYPEPKQPRALVTEISRVLALTGPTVVAVDQLDSLIDRAAAAGELALIAGGLMRLREVTRRTLSIVACLPTTWTRLHSVATDTVADRFTETPFLGSIVDPRLGRALVARWLGVIYEGIGFTPPHPTWPVAPGAFGDSWTPFTPRQLLRRIQEHAETCMYGEIRELTSFDEPVDTPAETVTKAPPEVGPEPDYFAEFDRRFAALREQADVDTALSHHTENEVMPDLLLAALRSWITEIGNDDQSWGTELPDGGGQLHAGLRRLLDEERDIVERWMFRSIAPRHGNTVLRLVREAKAAAGIRPGARNRHLVFLRQSPKGWTGAKTKAEVRELDRLEITKDEVRTFYALKEMLTKQSYELLNWLVVRKPSSRTTFLGDILPDPTRSRATRSNAEHQSQFEHQETRPPPEAPAGKMPAKGEVTDEVSGRKSGNVPGEAASEVPGGAERKEPDGSPGRMFGTAPEAVNEVRSEAAGGVSGRVSGAGPGEPVMGVADQVPSGAAGEVSDRASGTVPGGAVREVSGAVAGRAPDRVPGEAVTEVPDQVPGAVAGGVSDRVPGRVSGAGSGEPVMGVADQVPGGAGEVSDRASGAVPGGAVREVPGATAGRVPDRVPGRVSGAAPGEAVTEVPDQVSGAAAGGVSDRVPRRVFGTAPSKAASEVPGVVAGGVSGEVVGAGPEQVSGGPVPVPVSSEIVLGMEGEIRIELESLRKHAVIFAGSGTGKTVLLRRIVEECALRGVSAIVLDPNNDLARLGDAWPSPPEGWRPGDGRSAAEYLANTEVVVWTPGRAGGRPLSFHPLPDFAGVRDDADEFTAAVEAAVAGLVPHARVAGGAKGAVRGRAVLREALTYFARTDGRSLSAFVDVLAELPDGVSRLSTATKMAADLAETLRAAMVNDPLLGGAGEPADPAVLFTPTPGKRARISVVSFVGLPADEQRQGFVSQLQLEVFAWIKRNPATDRPLGGLFVMDEAQTIAPSGAWTASTQSTIMLASQARKYGLGLLLATQAPKGLHNQVTGNATTQFFGRLNSPAQIAAANDMARAKGGTVGDISLLERGQFYVTGETFGFRRMRAPLCLSHHPPGPLRLEEVVDRARDTRESRVQT